MAKFALLLIFLVTTTARADWAKNFGGWNGANVNVKTIVVDGSGNSFITGDFDSSTLDLGGVTLTRIGTKDAFVAKMDTTGTIVWAKNYGGAGASSQGRSVAVDGSGNVYLGGFFMTASLTTPALTIIGSTDSFALKLDSSGNTTWAKNYGGAGSFASVESIAVDGAGNVYLGGSFQLANLTSPVLTILGSTDAFAMKLDSSGNTTWVKNFGGTLATAMGVGITVDGSGNVYLGGHFSTTNLTTPALTKIGTQDVFIFKLDSSGNTTWAKNFGGVGAYADGLSITVDGSGNVYLGGDFYNANLTTPALVKISNQDAFAIKLDSSGNTTWAKNYGGSGGVASVPGIAVDGSGNVYLIGYFFTMNLTTPALTKIGTSDAFAMKLDSSGNTTWAKNFGGAGALAVGSSLAVDGGGNVYLAGYFQTANLTTPALTKVGGRDVFTFKLDSSGNTTWSKNYGGFLPTGNITVQGIAVDASRNSYITGDSTALRLVFGSVTLTRIGSQDAFVVKVDPLGTVLWAKNFGGSGATVSGQSITVDGTGNVYICGNFTGANLTNPAVTKIGTYDAFSMKLDSSGNVTWAKNFGGAGADAYATGIAVDSSGKVYLGGYFLTSSLTNPVLTKIGSYDAFAMLLDSSGNVTWAKNFGGAGAWAQARAIAVDGSGNVYLGGYFNSANLTNPALTKIGSADAFAFKLDSNGNMTWSNNYGGAGANAYGNRISVDGSGNIYLGGYFQTANLTTPALTKIGTADGFALKINSSGTTTWAKNYGGAGASAWIYGIAVDSSFNVYLAGYLQTANLTTPVLAKIGSRDVFAMKLDSSGVTAWAQNYGGTGSTATINGIATDGTGNIYLGGYFGGANFTSPALSKISSADALLINIQLFKTTCTATGKFKYDSSNNVMIFCDGSSWQSMNNATAATCTGTTAGKVQYYSNGASSDFVWYGGSCRSAKSSTTFGACAVNGKIEWDAGNSTLRGCINGTWTSLKGW